MLGFESSNTHSLSRLNSSSSLRSHSPAVEMPPRRSRKIAAAKTAPAALPMTTSSVVKTARTAHIKLATTLPSELIADVFGWLVLMWPPYSLGRSEGLSLYLLPALEKTPLVWSLGWICVTHVCRHWRSIALENACLWSKISFELGPRWTNEMRLRARNVPLEIEISTVYRRDLSNWREDLPDWQREFIILHLAEFAVLSLHTDSDTLTKLVAALGQSTPFLKELKLQPTDPYVGFSATLPVGSALQLRILDLSSCDIPWGSAVFRGLVVLQLQVHGYGPDYAPLPCTRSVPTLEQLLDTLRMSPSLQKLTLYLGFIPPELFNSRKSTTAPLPVSLPQLRRLCLTEDPYVSAQLFAHLDLPSSTEILLLAVTYGQPDDHYSLHGVVGPLRHRFSPQCSKPLHVISIGGEYDWELTISATESQRYHLPAPLKFVFSHRCLGDNDPFWMDWLVRFFSELPQGSLRGIRVQKDIQTLMHGVFEHPSTTNVDAIETTSLSCSAVLDAISKTNSTRPLEFASLPNLKTLIIEFIKPSPIEVPSDDCSDTSEYSIWDNLADASDGDLTGAAPMDSKGTSSTDLQKLAKNEPIDPFELCPDLIKQLALVLARRERLGARLRSVVLKKIRKSSWKMIYDIMRMNGVDTLRTVISFE